MEGNVIRYWTTDQVEEYVHNRIKPYQDQAEQMKEDFDIAVELKNNAEKQVSEQQREIERLKSDCHDLSNQLLAASKKDMVISEQSQRIQTLKSDLSALLVVVGAVSREFWNDKDNKIIDDIHSRSRS